KNRARLTGCSGDWSGDTCSSKLYDNKSCSPAEGGLIASDGPVAVSANGSYETPHGASPTASGTYYWVATYSGDANNKEAVSGCEIGRASCRERAQMMEATETPAS